MPRRRFKKFYVNTALKKLNKRRNNFLKRRPHRSFKKTARRDYKRSLALPGYWNFTNQVRMLIVQNKGIFLKFAILYSILSWLIFGLMSQENYLLMSKTVNSLGSSVFQGNLDGLPLNIAIFSGILGGAFTGQLTETQQIYGGLLVLLSWLTLVWLMRQIMAGHKNIRLRDGIYSSGSPTISTFLVCMVVLIQLIPFILALAAYFTANTFNVLGIPFFSILFWLLEILLVVASLYWLSSSFLALVVVTLPGMYPLKALKVGGDLAVGRRLRILYRLTWLVLCLFFLWLLVLLPIILLSDAINISWLPLVPLTVLVLGSASIIWASAYIYLLYRKLVDDGASPA